jgi:hypothetical protein
VYKHERLEKISLSGKEVKSMAKKHAVPGAAPALFKMKYEVASSLGVNLKQGYNGDLSARQSGSIGGQVTKRLIQQAENRMSGR